VKINYDAKTDSLTVILREGARVVESDEDKPGVILDYDADGNLISIEVLEKIARGSSKIVCESQVKNPTGLP
jgi:uncharacterized protein YuzE